MAETASHAYYIIDKIVYDGNFNTRAKTKLPFTLFLSFNTRAKTKLPFTLFLSFVSGKIIQNKRRKL